MRAMLKSRDNPKTFFGRRKGKGIPAAREDFYAENLPRFMWEAGASVPKGRAHLEIGYGSGEHLAALALDNPDDFFLGSEAFLNGNVAMLKSLAEHDVKNVRIFPDDANLLLPSLADASFDNIYVLYPDPWPKNRHEARRMIGASRLKTFHRLLKPGGELLVVSDHPVYIPWVLMRMRDFPGFLWSAAVSSDFTAPPENWRTTRYEQKALRDGRTPIYLRFKKL